MKHSLCTFVAPLDLDRKPDAETIIDRLGNPARPDIESALDVLDGEAGTHFASLHAFTSVDLRRSYILLEFSADGTDDESLMRIVKAIGEQIRPVFMLASDWREGGDLAAYLRSHQVRLGAGWFDNPGVAFVGTPGMSVGRIRYECDLAAAISQLVGDSSPSETALEHIDEIRDRLATANPRLADALDRGSPETPFEAPSLACVIASIAFTAIRTYLWPVGIVVALWAIWTGMRRAVLVSGLWSQVEAFLRGAAGGLWTGFWVALLLVLAAAGVTYVVLRRAEARDFCDGRAPLRAVTAAIFERENRSAQNHMISVTQRKPGPIRRFTSRLVFLVLGELASRFYTGS
jgi:hypothetical protein